MQKEDTIQNIPIYSTLNTLLRHKGVLTHIYAKISPQNGVIRTFRDSLSFKNNNFSNSSERVSKICLYHDKFSIIYPMGNKTQKNIVLFHFRKFATKIYLRSSIITS